MCSSIVALNLRFSHLSLSSTRIEACAIVKTVTSSTDTESRGNYEKEWNSWMFQVSVHRPLSTGESVEKRNHLEERIYVNTTEERQVDLTLL